MAARPVTSAVSGQDGGSRTQRSSVRQSSRDDWEIGVWGRKPSIAA